MHAAISQGTLEAKGIGTFRWWIGPSSAIHSGICIHEEKNDRFLPWSEFRERVTKSGNVLAMVLAEKVAPQMTSHAYCGRVTVPSLDELNGIAAEKLLRFLDVFICSTLRRHPVN